LKKIILGLTGASGSIYFTRLVDQLCLHDVELRLIASSNGEKVCRFETGIAFRDQIGEWNQGRAKVTLEENDNLFSAAASGSARFDAMAIVPCSMSTLAMLANGLSETLMTRAADVMLKERRKLVLVPRETPLSAIHLRNMARLSELGATILPAMPGFYGHPQTIKDLIDFVVGKTLDCLEIENQLYQRWEGYYEEK